MGSGLKAALNDIFCWASYLDSSASVSYILLGACLDSPASVYYILLGAYLDFSASLNPRP